MKKLLDQYNNTYHHSIGKKPATYDYSTLIQKIGTNSKTPKFKVNDRVRLIFLAKVTLKIGQEKYLLSILC